MAVGGEGGVKIKLEKLSLDTDQGILDSEHKKWGLTLKEVYRLGLSFYKDKEGKAIHLSYEDKLNLIAYTQQAIHGPFNEKTAPPLGVLDVIGRDRRAAWLELGNMSHTQAMAGFIHMLDRLCPLFKTYVEANRKDSIDKSEKKAELDRSESIDSQADEDQKRIKQQKASEEEQVRRIKDALNAQTYEQFLEYAKQQFPSNPDQQAVLVRQLQDQHYHQYIQQLALNRQGGANQPGSNPDTNKEIQTDSQLADKQMQDELLSNADKEIHRYSDHVEKHENEHTEESSPEQQDDSQSEDGDSFPAMAEPSMWTRSGLVQFKQAVRAAAGGGGVLQVGHGETLTVRVPTHQDGRCLFWEFATDNFDIGFGVYFEWIKSPTTQVTVHVAESDDEGELDQEDFEDEDEIISPEDPEMGNNTTNSSSLAMIKAPVSIIIPIFRRDSHLEIYAGSHTYPGEGVYLLKFDNTFSLWRSKTLFYRVYYTR